ncbi:MAG: chorismate-binding protein, partial [Xanthomonadales bacterium]|nr:chorismate-binding protein [Xanthomonadales bacterium]
MTGQRIRLSGQPDFKAVHARWPERYPFLLESAVQGTPQARYDILFAATGEYLELDAAGTLKGRHCRRRGFLNNLDEWWSDLATHADGDLPFTGGWFLYLGYELAAEIEPTLTLPPATTSLPVAYAARCPAGLVHDHQSGHTWAVAEAGAESLLERLLEDLGSSPPASARNAVGAGAVSEECPQQFERALERIHEYILDGDVFQVNLSRGWNVQCQSDADSVYAALCRANPAPFAGSARIGSAAVL